MRSGQSILCSILPALAASVLPWSAQAQVVSLWELYRSRFDMAIQAPGPTVSGSPFRTVPADAAELPEVEATARIAGTFGVSADSAAVLWRETRRIRDEVDAYNRQQAADRCSASEEFDSKAALGRRMNEDLVAFEALKQQRWEALIGMLDAPNAERLIAAVEQDRAKVMLMPDTSDYEALLTKSTETLEVLRGRLCDRAPD